MSDAPPHLRHAPDAPGAHPGSRRSSDRIKICTWCGGDHAKVDKEDDCFAVMLAKGKSMPHKYNLFSDVGKAAIKERAKEYKELGPFKDRPKVMITKPIMDHCP